LQQTLTMPTLTSQLVEIWLQQM